MQAEDLIINQRSERQVVEEIREEFPNIRIPIFSQAFIIESVYLCNLT